MLYTFGLQNWRSNLEEWGSSCKGKNVEAKESFGGFHFAEQYLAKNEVGAKTWRREYWPDLEPQIHKKADLIDK